MLGLCAAVPALVLLIVFADDARARVGVSIYAGLHGTEAPDRNFALTFPFVTCWLGFPFLSAIFGDVFRPFNPWRALGRAAGAALLHGLRSLPVSAERAQRCGARLRTARNGRGAGAPP